jgi:hypothetical protein
MRRSGGVLTVLLLGMSLVIACYRPSIQTAGLRCAEGGACPEGYHCGADRRCYKGATRMCLPDAGAVTPMCSDQPLGEQCDPVCQQGCECGRCNLVGDNMGGAKLDCVPPGAKARGEFCNVASDDCGAGLVCLLEQCMPENPDAGPQLGRCYRYCAGDQHCDGTSCNVNIVTAAGAMSACQLPPRACDPVVGNGTCGNTMLGCYIDSNGRTFCECSGTAALGEPCGVFTDCVPGFRCVQQGAMTPRCRQVCRLGASDCGAASACMGTPGDAMFGYCTP